MTGAAERRLADSLRFWLCRALPPAAERRRWVSADPDVRWESRRRWHRALNAGGWIGLSWPVEHGGAGLAPAADWIAADVLAAHGAPLGLEGLSAALVAPLLIAAAPSLAWESLGPIQRGEQVWCFAFTEDASGSDLAAIRVKAARAGTGWRLTGVKAWSSHADRASRVLVLARAPEGPTLFAAPLGGPAVRVRPLRQATGESGFAEVTFTGLRLPSRSLIGLPGRGLELLQSFFPQEYLHPAATAWRAAELAGLAARPGRGAGRAEELGALAAEAIGLRAYARETAFHRWPPHPADASGVKALSTRLAERMADAALAWDATVAAGSRTWRTRAVAARGGCIAHGPTEVHLNLVSRLGLILPREGA